MDNSKYLVVDALVGKESTYNQSAEMNLQASILPNEFASRFLDLSLVIYFSSMPIISIKCWTGAIGNDDWFPEWARSTHQKIEGLHFYEAGAEVTSLKFIGLIKSFSFHCWSILQ
jgi:hypothetical protein